jgi:hypothetical protein
VRKVWVTARRQDIVRDAVDGFVESNSYIAIEAAHTSMRTRDEAVQWQEIPGFGHTLSAMTVLPSTAESNMRSKAGLHYRIHTYDTGKFTWELDLAPTLNFVPGRGLRLAVSVDDGPRKMVDALEHNTEHDWEIAVRDNLKKVTVPINLVGPGDHALNIWFVDPGVVIERLVLSRDPLPTTYLGPPESFHAAVADAHR